MINVFISAFISADKGQVQEAIQGEWVWCAFMFLWWCVRLISSVLPSSVLPDKGQEATQGEWVQKTVGSLRQYHYSFGISLSMLHDKGQEGGKRGMQSEQGNAVQGVSWKKVQCRALQKWVGWCHLCLAS